MVLGCQVVDPALADVNQQEYQAKRHEELTGL